MKRQMLMIGRVLMFLGVLAVPSGPLSLPQGPQHGTLGDGAPAQGEIGFIRDGDVWSVNLATGQDRRITNTSNVESFAWHPSGQSLVVAAYEDSQNASVTHLYAMQADNPNPAQISVGDGQDFLPAFSADGTLYFARITDGQNSSGATWSVIRQNKTGGDSILYSFQSRGCGIRWLSVSSDGQYALTKTCEGTANIIIGRDPGDSRQLSDLVPSIPGCIAWGAWAHTRTTLALFADSDCFHGQTATLYTVDPEDPTSAHALGTFDTGDTGSLSWSNDDQLIVLNTGATLDSTDNSGLDTVSVSNGQRTRVYNGYAPYPQWRPIITAPTPPPSQSSAAPTNGQIAFERDSNIYLIDLSTGQITQLTQGESLSPSPQFSAPAWSPDGKTLAFVGTTGGNPEIYTMQGDGSAQTRLADIAGDFPTFGPDGTLYFINQNNALARYNPGSAATVLYQGDDTGHCFLSNPTISNDNRFALGDFCSYNRGGLIIGSLDAAASAQRIDPGDVPICNRRPRWAHERSLLAFWHQECGAGIAEGSIYIATYSGSQASSSAIFSGEGIGSIGWSPDDQWLVFSQFGETDHTITGLWVIPSTGGIPQQISEVGTDPAWSPAVDTPTVTPQTDSLCGFVGLYRTVNYGFKVCGGQFYTFNVPGDPIPSGYYQVFDPVIMQKSGSLDAITGWSRMEPISSCERCGIEEDAPGDIRITNFTILDPEIHASFTGFGDKDDPTVLNQAVVWVEVTNKGEKRLPLLPDVTPYQVQIVVRDAGVTTRTKSYTYGNELDLQLETLDPGESKSFSLNDLWFFDVIQNGEIQVYLLPDSRLGKPSTTEPKPLRVKQHPDSVGACLAGAAQQFLIAAELGCELYPDPTGMKGEGCKQLINHGDLALALVKCGEDKACVAEEGAAWVAKNGLDKSLEMAFGTNNRPAGVGGWLVKSIADALRKMEDPPPCLKVVDWITAQLQRWNELGIDVNGVSTQSPVYPLITDGQGRRAGFLPNGQIVIEIPDAYVAQVGEKRFVLYAGVGQMKVDISGYDTGTMTVSAVFADGDRSGRNLLYNNVSVARGMQATLNSLDAQANLNIDNDGDGQPNKVIAPDKLETIGQSNSAPSPTLSSATATATATPSLPASLSDSASSVWLMPALAGVLILILVSVAVYAYRRKRAA